MLFPVIGCFLALFPIATSVPQPLQANRLGSFFGAYHLREIDFYNEIIDNPQDYVFDARDDGMVGEPIIYYYTENTYQLYNDFSITYDISSYRWTFNFSIAGYTSYQFYLDYYDEYFSNQSNDAKYFTLYFETYEYFSPAVTEVLNFFFEKQPNQYHEIYTGYYTFSNTISGSYSLYGHVSANNVLFDRYTYDPYKINFYYGSNSSPYTLYENSKFNASRSIYFSGMHLPTPLKNYMEARGVFAYVPQTELSDFQDLFFAIADTPIYFLTTWFNFSLLGFNVGIAITSLLTLLLIIFILRKLI